MNAYESHRQTVRHRIYDINEKDFDAVALAVFEFQYQYNALYRSYCDIMLRDRSRPMSLAEIPCLPIAFFRDHEVKTGNWEPMAVFRSSSTTQSASSRHFIRDIDWYHHVAARCFSRYFKTPSAYTWIGLLPSYLERPDSSLVDMVQFFMQHSKAAGNGFYLARDPSFDQLWRALKSSNERTILIGVSFAVLDLFENPDVPVWDELTVIETGGMKGRRDEITREELHSRMRRLHPSLQISSEYGMTEMMSQAYLVNNVFRCGPTLKIWTRDISDPLQQVNFNQRGAINVIDLGNMDTCCFIATDDVGISYVDGSFDVLGRLDQSEVRGCNLMYA